MTKNYLRLLQRNAADIDVATKSALGLQITAITAQRQSETEANSFFTSTHKMYQKWQCTCTCNSENQNNSIICWHQDFNRPIPGIFDHRFNNVSRTFKLINDWSHWTSYHYTYYKLLRTRVRVFVFSFSKIIMLHYIANKNYKRAPIGL